MIRRFFDRSCNEEEATLVARWLKDHPEVADQYYKESDWIHETGEQLPAAGWDAIWRQVIKTIRRRNLLNGMAYSLSAALCILLCYIFMFRTSEQPVRPMAVKQPVVATDSLHWRNDSDTAVQHIFADGTVVQLMPHSYVKISQQEWKKTRAVYMKGAAVFHVAPDQERPFVTYCNSLSVQALGTVFSIKQGSDDYVSVRLYEGKVMVKSVADHTRKTKAQFTSYLKPGQELILPLNTLMPRRQYFLQGQRGTAFVKKRTVHKTPVIQPTGWFEFTSQPLTDVFTTLEVLYGVQIHYNKATLEKLFFIGRFEPDESIEDILGTIALLNNLKVTKRSDNNYYVNRKG
ncbi:FecR family protein [Chitinophaga rhizophila]|uniref:FecR family protein n=1 Tax=Chitinophaga rhizophila TaxID=2866212 RepID=A0ABS7GDT5_9BACT|nr:FecR family protein [Chitinophaga rhizophila]MBW8684673.1 FecR family protein [Chitinophaga rhizophila]